MDVHIHPDTEIFSVENNTEGIEKLVKRMKNVKPEKIVLEATGGYELYSTVELASAGLPVVVVNPRQVKHFAQAIGQLAKTDKIDAGTIALFAEVIKPEIRPLPDSKTQELHQLITRRRQLIKMITAEKNHFGTTLGRVRKNIEKTIKYLEKQLLEIENDLNDFIRNTPVWKEKEKLLKSVPGIGNVTSFTLLAELPV